MNAKLRKIIFWSHLVAGLVAGVVIAIMSFTGAAIAFEKEIIAWVERDARRVAPPSANAARLPLDELLAKARDAQPDFRASGVTVFADPTRAVLAAAGRNNSFYVNPYTGEVLIPKAEGTRRFLRLMTDWHRWLGQSANGRAVGKAITGACNVAFCLLAISGLYLWWPRQWTASVLRGSALFNFKLSGKARDWNWHNVIGLWSAPILIVLTVTALPISYRRAGDLIYKLTGSEPPPPAAGPGAAAQPAVEVPPPPPGTRPLGSQALLAAAQEHAPAWKEITLRLGGGGGRGGGSGRAASSETGARPERLRGESAGEARGPNEGDGRRSGPAAAVVSIKEKNGWPLFAAAQYTLDPFTGKVLRREAFSDYNLDRKVRSWTRFLHTGEALGWAGQLVAGLASLGGVVLAWTGFALALRRFFGRKSPTTFCNPPAAASPG